MRSPLVNYGWNPIESAPLDEDIALQVTDGRGGPYTLRWPCRRTASAWINSRKGTPSWRAWQGKGGGRLQRPAAVDRSVGGAGTQRAGYEAFGHREGAQDRAGVGLSDSRLQRVKFGVLA
jgi:hypothetical protein